MKGTIIFTDGSSRGNPGPGGWAALIMASGKEGKVIEIGGREENTTNNRMELTAALEALKLVEERKYEGPIEVRTDSAYVLQGVTLWAYGWEKNGWKTKEGEPVLNQDIWKELVPIAFRLKKLSQLTWVKVSGHAGIAGNERVDEIATMFADGTTPLLFSGSYTQYEKLFGNMIDGSIVTTSHKKKTSKGIAYSYVSVVDGVVETHKTWVACEKRVKGKKGVKFKKVFSPLEEAELIETWSSKT